MNDKKTDIKGYLLSYTLPDVKITTQELQAIASQAGFPLDCVPTGVKPLSAWRTGTNVGATGIEVTPPADLVSQVEAAGHGTPRVRVLTKIIKDKRPDYVRHLVREVIVPDQKKERVLDYQTIAVCTFDHTTNKASYTEVPDQANWANGSTKHIITQIDDRVSRFITFPDPQLIRKGIRRWLEIHHRVALRGTGGLYFLPQVHEGEDNIETTAIHAAVKYVSELKKYAVSNKLEPSILCYPLTQEGDAFKLLDEAKDAAIAQIDEAITLLVESLAPVIEETREGKNAVNTVDKAFLKFAEIKAATRIYRQSLDDRLTILDIGLARAESTIEKARILASENKYAQMKSKGE